MQSPTRPTRLDFSSRESGRLQSPTRPVGLRSEFEFQVTQRAPVKDYHHDPTKSPVRVGNLMRRLQRTPTTSSPGGNSIPRMSHKSFDHFDESNSPEQDFAYSSDSYSDDLITGFFSPRNDGLNKSEPILSQTELQMLNELGHHVHNNNTMQCDINPETLLSKTVVDEGQLPDTSEELNSQGDTADGSTPFAAISSVPIWLAQSLEMHGFVEANSLQRECFAALAQNKKVLSCSGRRSGRAIALMSTALAYLDCNKQAVQILIAVNSPAAGKGITRLMRDVLQKSVQQHLSEDMWEHIVVNLEEDGKLSANIDRLRRNGSIGMPVSLIVVGTPKLLSELIAKDQFSISELRYFGVHWSERNATPIDARSLLDVEQFFPSREIKIVMCSDAPQPQLQDAARQLEGELQIINLKSIPSRNFPSGAGPERKVHQLHVPTNEAQKLEFASSTAEYIEPDGPDGNKIIIVCNSKRKSELVSRNLQISKTGRGKTGVVHHGLPEQLCSKAIRCYNNNTYRILVTTDPYLDVICSMIRVRPRVVIGFDFPESALLHVNRTRVVTTAMNGYIITLCTGEDAASFKTGLAADPVYVAAVLTDRSSAGKVGPQLPAQAMSLASPKCRRLLRKEFQQQTNEQSEYPHPEKWIGLMEHRKVEKREPAAVKVVSPPRGSFKTTSKWEPPSKPWGAAVVQKKQPVKVTKVPIETKRWMPPPIKKTVAREPNQYMKKDGQLIASGYPQKENRPRKQQEVISSHSIDYQPKEPPPITSVRGSPPTHQTTSRNNVITKVSNGPSFTSTPPTREQPATSETVKLEDLMGAPPPQTTTRLIDDKSETCSTTSEAVPPSQQLLNNRRSSQISAASSSIQPPRGDDIPAVRIDLPSSLSSRGSSITSLRAQQQHQQQENEAEHQQQDDITEIEVKEQFIKQGSPTVVPLEASLSDPSPRRDSPSTSCHTEGSVGLASQPSSQMSGLPLQEQEDRIARIEAALSRASASSNSAPEGSIISRRTSSRISESYSRRSSDLGTRVEEEIIAVSTSQMAETIISAGNKASRSPSGSIHSSTRATSLKSDSQPSAGSSLPSSRRTSGHDSEHEEFERRSSPSGGSSMHNTQGDDTQRSSLKVSFRVGSPGEVSEDIHQESESSEHPETVLSPEEQEKKILQTVDSVNNLFVNQIPIASDGENTSSLESEKGDETPTRQANEKVEPPSDESRSSLAATLPIDQHKAGETFSTVPDVPFDITMSTHHDSPPDDAGGDLISNSETQSTVDTVVDDEEEMLMQLFIFADNDCDGILSLKELNLLLRHTTGASITESQFEDLLRDLNSDGLTIEGLRTCLVESSPGGIEEVYKAYRQSQADSRLERALSTLTSMRSMRSTRTSTSMSTFDLNASKRFSIDGAEDVASTM
eukprot:TRINITY_DN2873_c7_g1_i1.p1 TRINITY_DN2873_c7_g1~~TRINITY_DN2873_c7_g1_i1.p1  ORF type:complete len:1397 (+),score=322.39 TRINITY_DN2873_c7_g1_i1:159-4349(+)